MEYIWLPYSWQSNNNIQNDGQSFFHRFLWYLLSNFYHFAPGHISSFSRIPGNQSHPRKGQGMGMLKGTYQVLHERVWVPWRMPHTVFYSPFSPLELRKSELKCCNPQLLSISNSIHKIGKMNCITNGWRW